jgi:ABC transporter substrate binding protein
VGKAEEGERRAIRLRMVDGTAAAKACKGATATIPIVFALAVDPVADGLAASFARPDGNLTGLTMAAGYALAGKRVELLKDMGGKPLARGCAQQSRQSASSAQRYSIITFCPST